MVSLVDRSQPDFSAPSGESLRQVEFRMVEFINRTILGLPHKLQTSDHQMDGRDFSRSSQWDIPHRHSRQGLSRKRSGKSRLQFVAKGENETEEEVSSVDSVNETNGSTRNLTNHSSIGVFSHAVPIKCLLAGILGCGSAISSRICIDDSSVSVIWHSPRTGWQVKRVNDTAHLRLL